MSLPPDLFQFMEALGSYTACILTCQKDVAAAFAGSISKVSGPKDKTEHYSVRRLLKGIPAEVGALERLGSHENYRPNRVGRTLSEDDDPLLISLHGCPPKWLGPLIDWDYPQSHKMGRVRRKPFLRGSEVHAFPSWSWPGWVGTVSFTLRCQVGYQEAYPLKRVLSLSSGTSDAFVFENFQKESIAER